MDPISIALGLLVLVGSFKVAVKATADGYATVKAAQSGAFDFIDADRQRRASQREKLAQAWAERRRKRSKEAGGDGSYRPGAREYGRDLWHGFWEDKLDHRAKKRAGRPEWQYDPDRKPWHVRFDEAVLAKVEKARESRGWDKAKAAAKKLVEPVGEKSAEPVPPSEKRWCEQCLTAGCESCRDCGNGLCECAPAGYDDGRVKDVDWARTLAVYEDEGRNIAARRAVEDDNAGYFDPAHRSGHPDEDMLVRTGGCPYLVVAGWDPPHYCSVNRSPHEGDHPYCREHAASIRDDRGRGGYVAPAGDVDDHLPIEPTNQTSTPTASTGGTTMTAPTATEVNNNEDARRAFQQQIDYANQTEEALSVYEAAQQRLFGAATAGLDGISAKRFDTQAQAAQANAADLLPQSDMSQAAAAIEGIRASAEAGMAALDKYRDSEQLVNDNNVDGKTLETASSS